MRALVSGVQAYPLLNASLRGDDIVQHQGVNIGIAVALEWGLIVPVVKNVQDMSVLAMARASQDLGQRARTKKLLPDEVQGGTITITNPGVFGGLFGTPIINQPQVAIMGMGGVKKRVVVLGDAIAIRPIMLMPLSFDHRLIDGAVADQFMAHVVDTLENFEEALL
jgi:2-oxoglutarate dehydrogenase E2 component (dihydrolipoamide succinyltransferase)